MSNKVYKLVQGNEACVEGALAAGMRFFAGYPISPSTEIAEISAEKLPALGGRFIQMEDELADILIYSVLFADAINADIPSIIKNKLKKNSERYAVSKAYGNAKKYTEFSDTE